MDPKSTVNPSQIGFRIRRPWALGFPQAQAPGGAQGPPYMGIQGPRYRWGPRAPFKKFGPPLENQQSDWKAAARIFSLPAMNEKTYKSGA